jgi:peptidylprolyl isomerase
MARKRDRAFAGFGAALFLVTSSALTIAVVVSMADKKDDPSATANTANSTTDTSKEKPVDPSNQLAGKPLADFTPTASIPELQTTDTTPGTGDEVKASDTVTVDYTGAVAATGVVFQSSKDSGQPVSFSLSQVIAGWTQGIPGMKVGGTRRLLIPANLAYGANPPQGSGIPANADLVFDVTLHKIGK